MMLLPFLILWTLSYPQNDTFCEIGFIKPIKR
jgi:hypothetical protein